MTDILVPPTRIRTSGVGNHINYAVAQYAICESCGLKHLAMPNSLSAIDFFERHKQCRGPLRLESRPNPVLEQLHMRFGADLFRRLREKRHPSGREREQVFDIDRYGFANYRDNADVKEAFGTATAMTITNGQLASSATAGWQGAAVDNTSNLYTDYHVGVEIAALNVAPASDKVVYVFVFGLVDPAGTAYTATGDGVPGGSEGTLTYPNVSTVGVLAPPLGQISYSTQNRALNYGPMSVSSAFQTPGAVPSKWAPGIVNFSGENFNNGNILTAVRQRGVYTTVI